MQGICTWSQIWVGILTVRPGRSYPTALSQNFLIFKAEGNPWTERPLHERSKLVLLPQHLFLGLGYSTVTPLRALRTRPGASGEREATDLEVGAMGDGKAQRWGLARAVGPEPDAQRQEQRQQQRSEPRGPAQRGNEAPAPELRPGHASGSPNSRAVPHSRAAPALRRGGAGPSSPAGQGRSWAVAKSGGSGAAGERDRGRGAPSTSSPGSQGLGAQQTVDSSVYRLPSMCLSLALCHSCFVSSLWSLKLEGVLKMEK